jgi:hypothetical protein
LASWNVYANGSATTATAGVSSSTSITVPSSGVTLISTHSFTVAQNNTVTVPVSMYFEGRTPAGALITSGQYAVQLNSINWVSALTGPATTTFMSGLTGWRTSTISLP